MWGTLWGAVKYGRITTYLEHPVFRPFQFWPFKHQTSQVFRSPLSPDSTGNQIYSVRIPSVQLVAQKIVNRELTVHFKLFRPFPSWRITWQDWEQGCNDTPRRRTFAQREKSLHQTRQGKQDSHCYKVGIWNSTIRNPETIEIRTFWWSDFKWSGFQMAL